jgi:hypothetical protein
MTEAEWSACREPQEMLEAVRASGRVSDRKLRLFAVACCRRIWDLMTDESSRRIVERAERHADDPVGDEETRRARAVSLWEEVRRTFLAEGPRKRADFAAAHSGQSVAWDSARGAGSAAVQALAAAKGAVGGREAALAAKEAERLAQAESLRCIFGPLPFRAAPALPADVLFWNSGCVVQLAAGIYGESAFDRLPILGDALEEAGVTDQEVLAHARSPGPHAKGCWLIDLLLNKGELDPSRLAVLADALEDAGCPQNHEVLLHLRGPGPHVRGCFAVDLLTGRQ